MADEKQKQETADQIRAAAERRRQLELEVAAALAAFGPAAATPGVPDASGPRPPPIPMADVPTPLDEAQQFTDLLGALEKRQAELQHGSTTSTGAKAGQLAEDSGLSDTSRPAPLPAERSWTDQFLRTFGQQVIREDQAPPSLWDRAKAAASAGIDMNPLLRTMENPLAQALQARTRGLQNAESDGSAVGNVSAGLQRGVGRAIDAFVPDSTTGEAVTGVRTQGGVEVLDQIGQGVEGIGRKLQGETANQEQSAFEVQKAKAGLALEALGRSAQLPKQAVETLDAFTGHRAPAEPGMQAESGTLALLRLATAPMAAAVEAGKAVPVPLGTKSSLAALGLREDLRPPLPADATLADKALRAAEPVTLGEMIGVPSGAFQQIDRSKPTGVDRFVPAPIRNYTQAVLERIEKQQGLEAEGEAIATQLGGEEWARTGWVVGAIADAVLEPERVGVAMLGKGAKIAQRAGALAEVAPDLSTAQRLMQAASQPTVQAGQVYGGQFVEALRTGRATLEDMPAAVRAHADDIAAERKVLLEEQFALDGLAPMPTTVGEAGRARQAVADAEYNATLAARRPFDEAEALLARANEAEARAAALPARPKEGIAVPTPREVASGPGKLDAASIAAARRMELEQLAAAATTSPSKSVSAAQRPLTTPGMTDLPAAIRDLRARDERIATLERAADEAIVRERKARVTWEAAERKREKTPVKAGTTRKPLPSKAAYEQARAEAAKAKAEVEAALRERPAVAPLDEPGGRPPPSGGVRLGAARGEPPAPRVDPVPEVRPARPAPAEPVATVPSGVQMAPSAASTVNEAAAARARAEAALNALPAPRGRSVGPMSPSKVYVVRNTLEDELHVTQSLDEALDWMRERGVEGDRVWDDQAPVAFWLAGADGTSKIRPSTKASGYNEAVIAAEADRPGRKLRLLFTPEQREVGTAAANAMSGMPAGAIGDLPSEQIVRDAYSRWALDRTGADELTFLPNGAQVTHADRARIMRSVDADLRELGLAPPAPVVGLFGAKKATGQVTGGSDVEAIGRQFSAEEKLQIGKLADKYRMKVPPDVSTTRGLRALREAAVAYHGGAIASSKSAVRGTPGLADQIQTAIETFNTDRQARSKAALAVRPIIAPLLEGFFSNPTAGLSPAARTAILRGRSRLERLADEVLGGLKAEISEFRAETGQRIAPLTQGQMAQVYRRVLGDDVPVTNDALELVKRLRDDGITDDGIREIADQVAIPAWAKSDPKLLRSAVAEWAARQEAIAAEWANDYLRSVGATGGLGVKPNDALPKFIAKNRDRLLNVYDEVFIQGRFDGPAVLDLFARVGAGPAGQGRIAINTSQAMLAFLVTRRRAEVLNDTLVDLERAGLVVARAEYDARGVLAGATDPHVFSATLAGTIRQARDGSQEMVYSPGAMAWARRRAARMGIEPGSGPGEDLVALASGGQTYMVPRYIHQRLMASLTTGKVNPIGIDSPTALTLTGAADVGVRGSLLQTAGAVDQEVLRIWKALQTSGAPLLPRTTYGFAQGLSSLFSLWSTRGVVEAIKSAPDVAKSIAPTKVRVLFPDLVSQMMGRLASPGDGPAPRPRWGAERFLRDVNGQLHDIDDLVQAAREHGLADTLLSFETARHLESLLFSEMTTAGRVAFGPAAYQEMVTEFFGGFDQAARLSTFLREVERGTPMGDAAKLARQSALDFRDITNFEATVMRRIFTWYALQRKTADTLVREALRNPGRITSQMRLSHNLATDGLTAEQQGALTDRDVSSIWLQLAGTNSTTEGGVNAGRTNPRWYWRARTPPVQIPEFLSNLAFFLSPPAVGVEEYAGAVNPLVDMAAIAVAGRKTMGAGADVEATRNAVVPSVFMRVPFGGAETIVNLFDIAPVSLRSPDLQRSTNLIPDPEASEQLGEDAVWVVGAGDSTPEERATRRRMWAEFMMFLGGQAKTASGYSRAAGLEPPRPDLTWEQEALFPLGVDFQRLPTTQETIDQFRIDRGMGRKAETKAQEGMTGEWTPR